MDLRQPKQYSVGSVCDVDLLVMDACQAADQAIQILLSSAPASLLAQKASLPSFLKIRFLFSSTLPRHHQT